METCNENDILATIMIQNNVSYQTAMVLLLIYRDSILHFQKTDSMLEHIIQSALKELQELTGFRGEDEKKPTLAVGFYDIYLHFVLKLYNIRYIYNLFFMIYSKVQKAFTLVELIIVITILSILATLAFVSFQNYIKDSRDSHRLTTLKNIESGLQAFEVKTGNFPDPDNYITIFSAGLPLLHQGVVGDSTTKILGLNHVPLDPLRNENFIYTINTQKTKYELLTFLEKNNISFVSPTYAAQETKIPKVVGKQLGILLQSDNTPPTQDIDIVTYTGVPLKAIISETKVVVGTGGVLANINSNYDCQRIFDSGLYTQDGEYNVVQRGVEFAVYCSLKFPQTTFYNYIVDGDFEDLNGTNWNNNLKKSSSKMNGNYGLEIDGYKEIKSNNYTYVDTNKTYTLEGNFRSEGTYSGMLYYGFTEYDKDFTVIYSQHVNIVSGSETILTNSIVSTDMAVTIDDVNGTICNTRSNMPVATFTGNTYIAFDIDGSGSYNDLPNRNLSSGGFVSLVDNGPTCTIQLKSPVGKTYPAGIKIRLHLSGGTYNYVASSAQYVPFAWKKYTGSISGSSQFGINNLRFRKGTQFIKVLLLVNYRPGLPGNPVYDNWVASDFKMGIDDLKLSVSN